MKIMVDIKTDEDGNLVVDGEVVAYSSYKTDLERPVSERETDEQREARYDSVLGHLIGRRFY